jgi:hypothetical protein
MVAAVYHNRDEVKTNRRPKRSDRKPRKNVPMNRPANVAAMNAPTPERPKTLCVVPVRIPLFSSPGAM